MTEKITLWPICSPGTNVSPEAFQTYKESPFFFVLGILSHLQSHKALFASPQYLQSPSFILHYVCRPGQSRNAACLHQSSLCRMLDFLCPCNSHFQPPYCIANLVHRWVYVLGRSIDHYLMGTHYDSSRVLPADFHSFLMSFVW